MDTEQQVAQPTVQHVVVEIVIGRVILIHHITTLTLQVEAQVLRVIIMPQKAELKKQDGQILVHQSIILRLKLIPLGTSFLREIDKGLAKSKIGLVLVTPNFLKRVQNEGVADKELSVLLARDQLIPIVHNTTYDNLRDVSPLLGSRNGLDTQDDTMENIAKKLVELITV